MGYDIDYLKIYLLMMVVSDWLVGWEGGFVLLRINPFQVI